MTGARLTLAALGLLAFCVTAESVQQISFKVGADRAAAAPDLLRRVLAEPLVWFGAALWVVESIAWVMVLQRAPISLAYPVMTLTYACVPLGAVALLRERMSRRQMLGAALIFGGVVGIGIAGG